MTKLSQALKKEHLSNYGLVNALGHYSCMLVCRYATVNKQYLSIWSLKQYDTAINAEAVLHVHCTIN